MDNETDDITKNPEYIEGFEGILESDKERRRLSSAQLAIRLSRCRKDSPAHILLSHELDRRLGFEQIKSTRFAAYIGLLGVIVGAILPPIVSGFPQLCPWQCHKTPASMTSSTTNISSTTSIADIANQRSVVCTRQTAPDTLIVRTGR